MSTVSKTADVISCPACSVEIPLTEAVQNQVRSQMQAELAEARASIAQQSQELAAKEATLRNQKAAMEEQVRAAIEKQRQTLVEQSRKQQDELAKREAALLKQEAAISAKVEQAIEAERSRLNEESRKKAKQLATREEAILKQEANVAQQVEQAVEAERLRLNEQSLKKAQQLAAREEALQQQESEAADRIRKAVDAERTKLVEQSRAAAREELKLELSDKASQLETARAELRQAQVNELEMRKRERQLKDQAESMELELARRLDSEREKVRSKAKAEADEAHRLKTAEKELQIEGLRRKIDELKQRAEQGSTQTQGEALELDLESTLLAAFPTDDIGEVAKGVNGADVTQIVVSPTGAKCGSILWETKRTKNWSNTWLAKLRDDQRAAKASVAVIVSEALPPEVKTIGLIDGIWVCSRSCAMGLALALRNGILEIAKTQRAAEGRHEKVELVYNYLSGTEFQRRVGGIIEAFVALQDDLVTEKRAMQRRWSKREKQLERAVVNATGLYGDLEGIIGASMPHIEQIDQLELEDHSAT